MADFPNDLKYTQDHEWARTEGDKLRVGITQHAVEQLGDVTLVSFNVAVGDRIEAGQIFGTVESVKTVSDLLAPAAGTVVEVNAALDRSPELLNEDPYTKGWMIVLEGASLGGDLMDSQGYAAFVAS
jgi:glycine cleavage system H protein